MTKEELTEDLYCIGCGAKIQTDDPTERGYTPAAALQKGLDSGQVYCQRCFRLRHYNQMEKVSVTDDEFLAMLNTISMEDALIVNVIDLFDVYGSMIPGLHRFAGNNKVLVVGNKVDVLPKSVKLSRVKQWLTEQVQSVGLRPVDVMLVSGKKATSIDDLLETIEEHRDGKDVYVVGVTNVGKSTVMNQIIRAATGNKEDVITTSQFPGTTLDQIRIPLDDGHFLIDTPGIIHHHQMAHVLSPKELKLVAPQHEIKPITYQLNPEQTLFLGGASRFDFISGEKSSFTCYFANDLKIHRTKLEKADEFYAKHLGTLLQPPSAKDAENFSPLVRREFNVKVPSDIVFSGLGWITVRKPGKVAAWVPQGVDTVMRKPII